MIKPKRKTGVRGVPFYSQIPHPAVASTKMAPFLFHEFQGKRSQGLSATPWIRKSS